MGIYDLRYTIYARMELAARRRQNSLARRQRYKGAGCAGTLALMLSSLTGLVTLGYGLSPSGLEAGDGVWGKILQMGALKALVRKTVSSLQPPG